ncbi:MAG: hypothetical protein LBN18_00445 [Dysgonamonadaceae bacterium]|jgi:hypothetical protein|nr:hypothetical protein [Dysgonamonadaceae bacterium]
MIRATGKYIVIGFLLIIYINRGLFVVPTETSNDLSEINSVIEFLVEKATGQSNNTDEDGDSQETCNSVKIIQPYVSEQFAQSLDLGNQFPQQTTKVFFSTNENIPQLPVLGQIDHPPQELKMES